MEGSTMNDTQWKQVCIRIRQRWPKHEFTPADRDDIRIALRHQRLELVEEAVRRERMTYRGEVFKIAGVLAQLDTLKREASTPDGSWINRRQSLESYLEQEKRTAEADHLDTLRLLQAMDHNYLIALRDRVIERGWLGCSLKSWVESMNEDPDDPEAWSVWLRGGVYAAHQLGIMKGEAARSAADDRTEIRPAQWSGCLVLSGD
jgi:hypothetical protein